MSLKGKSLVADLMHIMCTVQTNADYVCAVQPLNSNGELPFGQSHGSCRTDVKESSWHTPQSLHFLREAGGQVWYYRGDEGEVLTF